MSQSQEKHAKFSVVGSKRVNTGVFMHALNLRTQWIGFIFDVRSPQRMENPNVSLLHDKMWLICFSNAQRLDNPVLRHVTVSPTVLCFAKIKISCQIGRSLKAPPSWKVTLNSFYLSAVKGWWGTVVTPPGGQAGGVNTQVCKCRETSNVGILSWYFRCIY